MAVFQQGLSGLTASQGKLEVIGNNVANANTVGFKASEAQFADVMAATIGGSSKTAIGGGARMNNVKQLFTQGSVKLTGNPLDLAISGDGFFKTIDNKGQSVYTRNGQFSLDNQGFIVNSDGAKLSGFRIDEVTGRPLDVSEPIKVSQDPLEPNASTTSKIRLNLDSREEPIDAAIPFDIANLESYNFSTSQVIYDQLGETKNLQVFWRKTGLNEFDVYTAVDGKLTDANPLPKLSFNADGSLKDPAAAKFDIKVPVTNPAPPADPTENEFSAGADGIAGNEDDNVITIDMRGSTQFGTGFFIQDLEQDGYDASAYVGFSIDDGGRMRLNYANGQSTDIAKIGLFRFKNPEGLQPVGNNGWLATLQAGNELSSSNDDISFGKIQAGAVEEANLDLTAELVDMIVAQRVYQANSQTIKTQDSMLQVVTNLR